MFSTTGLFKNISCPEGERCALLKCIFSHDLRPQTNVPKVKTAASASEALLKSDTSDDHVQKKRKIDDLTIGPQQPKPVSAAIIRVNDASTPKAIKRPIARTESSEAPPKSLQRAISPPTSKTKAVAKPATTESLNPRMIPNDPAGHARRTLYLRHMHEQMTRLNSELAKGLHEQKEALLLSDGELIKAVLDEEEQLARENASLYGNLIKLRISAYKKMKPDEWIAHVKATFAKGVSKPEANVAKAPLPLDTGLPLHQEYLLLPRLITDQTPLASHGYVITPPSAAEMSEASATVALSLNHEVCDRCKSRFRVFPERREEDGALTTNGPCIYHWGRPFYPKREKTDAIQGPKEAMYTCCNDLLNSKGCSEASSHAFKIGDTKRLASVLPFIDTPENASPRKGPNGRVARAVTFDCEMGYTVYGLELIRLTAVSWPEGDALVDVLVRPLGAILDLNSRFSGVWPEMYTTAIPYDAESPAPPKEKVAPPYPEAGSPPAPSSPPSLRIVASPVAARELLCSYLTPETPLIGHALENDLNSVRLCHPRIIDTVVLFPHPRGLPLRFGLKMLTKRHLGRDIQTGGAMGHDSLEDARATGDLVRWMVGKRWADLKRDGWMIEGNALMPPLPPGMPPPPSMPSVPSTPVVLEAQGRVLGAGAGDKRQRIQVGSGGVESERKRAKFAE